MTPQEMREYLKAHGVLQKCHRALNVTVRARPANPLTFMASCSRYCLIVAISPLYR